MPAFLLSKTPIADTDTLSPLTNPPADRPAVKEGVTTLAPEVSVVTIVAFLLPSYSLLETVIPVTVSCFGAITAVVEPAVLTKK